METDEFEIVTPIESGIDFITSDKVADNDVILLWDVDAQQWKNFTINSLQTMGMNQAQYLSHSIIFDKTTDITKVSGEVSYNGIDNVNVTLYEPNQEVNTTDDVTFSSVTVDEGIFADYSLLLESPTIVLRADNIQFLNKDGTKASIDMDVKGNVYGNANTADQVNHDFSILTTTTYGAETLGTLSFNGSENIKYYIYKPDQDINTNANVTFKTVIADTFTGNLIGNATSADKVNNTVTVKTVNTLETPTVITFDGSLTKSINIYEPNQEVNTTSTVSFNIANINTIKAGTASFTGIVEIDKNYYLKGNVQGNATSADKVNNTLTQNYTNKISEVTQNISFNGSSDKEIKTYRPNQDVNSTDDVTFKSVKGTSAISTPDLSIISSTGNEVGSLKTDENGKVTLNATTVNADLNGNAKTADKVNTAITVKSTDSKSGDVIDTITFDGSEQKSITLKQYDSKIKDLDDTDAVNAKDISDEISRAKEAEKALQDEIDKTNETVAGITSFEYQKVDTFDDLPEIGTKGVIYLVPRNPGTNNDIYTEYIYSTTNNDYESIGITSAELSNYVLTTTLTAYQEEVASKQEAQDTAISTETSERKEDIKSVTDLITTEANTRDTEYQELTKAISDEGKARSDADTDLQTNINTEASTRQKEDETLQKNIETEASTRQTNDETIQGNIDALTFVKSATLTEGDSTKDVLTLTNRDNTSLAIDIQKPLTSGTNIEIKDNVISATDTTYTQGDHISISDDNVISATYETATSEADGLMSKEDKSTFDTMSAGFNVYEIMQDETDGHIITLVGTGGKKETTSTVTVPDNDHKYTLSIDATTRELTMTGKLSDDDEAPLTSTVTLPDDDTRYSIEIYDHEFYMFTHVQHEEYAALPDYEQEKYLEEHVADGTLLHCTLPDNDHEYKAGNGITIDNDTGTISTVAGDTQFVVVDELPTTSIKEETIYIKTIYTDDTNTAISTYKMYMAKIAEDESVTWTEINKQESVTTATEADIDALFAEETTDNENTDNTGSEVTE